eukprot:m.193614 g.193614  ORF g.193614 m.193614 type:complete len:534 (+) comp14881_c0_seq12:264-1865(+)
MKQSGLVCVGLCAALCAVGLVMAADSTSKKTLIPFETVEVKEWDASVNLTELFKQGTMMPFKNSPVAEWPLSSHFGSVKAAKKKLAQDTLKAKVSEEKVVPYFPEGREGAAADFLADKNPRNLSFSEVTVEELFTEITSSDGTSHMFYSGNVAGVPSVNETFEADVNLTTIGADSVPGSRLSHLWIGGNNIATPLHFDLSNNLYVQLAGSKTFYILPPSEAWNTYLHPVLHRRHRTSQAEFTESENGMEVDTDAFPKAANIGKFLKVVLNAGDILVLPKGWLHQVHAGDVSISVNFWWSIREVELLDLLGKKGLLPHNWPIAEWPEGLLVRVVEDFVPVAIGSALLTLQDKSFLAGLEEQELAAIAEGKKPSIDALRHIAKNYVAHLDEHVLQPAMGQLDSVGCVPLSARLPKNMVDPVHEAAFKAGDFFALGFDHDVMPQMLRSWANAVPASVFGPKNAPGFLRSCVCGPQCDEASTLHGQQERPDSESEPNGEVKTESAGRAEAEVESVETIDMDADGNSNDKAAPARTEL